MIEFKEIFETPTKLLEISSLNQVFEVFDVPTILHLEGRRKERVFICAFLHGNEDAGLFAVQKLLRKYQNSELPRSVSIFFGNVAAARFGLRLLDNQCDYNRVWPSTLLPDCAEKSMMAAITEKMAQGPLFASIDIHNNTGKNPHYACVNVLSFRSLQLARLFSNKIVYFQNPKGVQSMAFAKFCPSVALECGKTGNETGAHHAFEFIDAVLHSSEIPNHALKPHEAGVFQTVARVQIPKGISFGFDHCGHDIELFRIIEQYNFSELIEGAKFANARNGINFDAFDDDGNNVADGYFENVCGEIRLKSPMMPAMLTLDEKVIEQDCLCYLMRKIEV